MFFFFYLGESDDSPAGLHFFLVLPEPYSLAIDNTYRSAYIELVKCPANINQQGTRNRGTYFLGVPVWRIFAVWCIRGFSSANFRRFSATSYTHKSSKYLFDLFGIFPTFQETLQRRSMVGLVFGFSSICIISRCPMPSQQGLPVWPQVPFSANSIQNSASSARIQPH